MENRGVQVTPFDRGEKDRGEQEVPDRWLQLCMLEDALDNNGDPGIVALLTGDGAGYYEGQGFHRTLERMHKRGMASGGALLGAFVQPGHAPMGGGERGVRAPGRPLRGGHLPRAVPPGARIRAGSGSGAAGPVAPPHGVTNGGSRPPLAGANPIEGAVALPAPRRPPERGSGLRASSHGDGRATASARSPAAETAASKSVRFGDGAGGSSSAAFVNPRSPTRSLTMHARTG